MDEPHLVGTCEHCSREFFVPPAWQGATNMCPHCGALTKYPCDEHTLARQQRKQALPVPEEAPSAKQDEVKEPLPKGPHKETCDTPTHTIFQVTAISSFIVGILYAFQGGVRIDLFFVVGAAAALISWQTKGRVCSECGNPVASESKVCPTCKSVFAEDS